EVQQLYVSFSYVAGTQPNLLLKHIDNLIQMTKEKQNVPAFYCLSQFLIAQAIYSEKQADESAQIFTGLLDKSTSDMRPTIFHYCQLIGVRYTQVLKSYRHIFIKYEKENSCRTLINFIDEKSGDDYADVIKNAQIEMGEFEKRIKQTEKDMGHFKQIVKNQELKTEVPQNTNYKDFIIQIACIWSRQKDILDLYKSLTLLGYRCWLDICQMGGGDSLYEKIDNGARNAKVIISCVRPKYVKSANCRREVSLADALKKPIIPLLLDTVTWPPPGPMSLVFTGTLGIDFYINVKNQTRKGFHGMVINLNDY
ncbi:unnamed protein product, partial [Didymodactylos carnosus]